MLKGKRSQAALEFLMTYGWAILVVLIVISALAYFGVLNPSRLLPSRCTMPSGFSCGNYIVHRGVGANPGNMSMELINGMGTAINIVSIQLSQVGATTYTCPLWTPAPNPISLANGATYTFSYPTAGPVVNCPAFSSMSADQKYRWDITIVYYPSDSTNVYSKTVKGELYTTTES